MTGVLPAVLVFGLGLAITVAPLTATALGSVARRALRPRIGGQQLGRTGRRAHRGVRHPGGGRDLRDPAISHPATLSAGFRTAVQLAAGLCVVAGVIAAVGIRNPDRSPSGSAPAERRPIGTYCALDAAPLTTEA